MDYETVEADALGRGLRGIGANLLTRDAAELAAFLTAVFGLEAFQVSNDFALIRHDGGTLQLHGHGTYGAHPLLGLLPESGPVGGGVQIYLFNCDPDMAVSRAEAAGGTVLEAPRDKPHGLREATVLSPEGFAFSAAVAVS